MTRKRQITIALLWIALAVPLIQCGKPDATQPGVSPWNVLLVTLDTTRADRLGCHGYERARTPNLDGLALTGVRFTNALAQTPTTLPSHTSIMTGTYPPFHGARGNGFYRVADENETLAEILRAEGYQTAAVIAAFVLERRFGLHQGFDIYDDETSADDQLAFVDPSRNAPEVNRAALAAIDSFDADRPFFLWAHYFDPHAPYAAPAEFQRGYPDDYSGRYDAEIAATDHYFGELLDALRSRGRMTNTIVVVIGDHGEGFPGPHGEMTHGVFLYQDTLHIPFIVHAPGLVTRATEVPAIARQIDVAPTLLDLLGISCDAPMQGRSLAAELRGEPAAPDAAGEADTLYSYAETVLPWDAQGWSPLFQIRDDRFKLILAPRPELYDLSVDPEQLDNIYSPSHPEVARLRARLESVRARSHPERLADGSPGQPISAIEAARLEQLGYVLANAETIPHDLDSLKDPKDFIDLQVQLEYARHYLTTGEEARGLELLRQILDRDPTNLEANQRLATWHRMQGNFDKALAVTESILAVRENWGAIYGTRGEIYMQKAQRLAAAGQRDEAIRAYRLAVDEFARAFDHNRFDPAHPARMGTIYAESLNEPAKAEEMFETALALDPDDERTHLAYGRLLFRLRRYAEARPRLEYAVRSPQLRDDLQVTVRRALAECLAMTGEPEAARDMLAGLLRNHASHVKRGEWQRLHDGLDAQIKARRDGK